MSDDEDASSSPVSTKKMERGLSILDILDRLVPGQHEWGSKTIHEVGDPGRAAGIKVIGDVIPHVSYQQETWDYWLDIYLEHVTSQKGDTTSISRREMHQTVQAAFGQNSEDEKEGSLIIKGTASDLDE